jgi:hypothetical protein
MARIRKSLIASAVAGLALTGLAGPAFAGVDPNLNHPAHYGPDCTKVEYADGTTSYAIQPGTTAYIKIGTVVYPNTNLSAVPVTIYFDKDISFVITCPAEPSS